METSQMKTTSSHIVREDKRNTKSQNVNDKVVSFSHHGFPGLLYQMLEDLEQSSKTWIASWIANGRAFIVHERAIFIATIVPQYFKFTKFKSFQRQLYLYGFSRIGSGKNKGAYFHDNFIRENRSSCSRISRQKKASSSNMAKRTIRSIDQDRLHQGLSFDPKKDSFLSKAAITGPEYSLTDTIANNVVGYQEGFLLSDLGASTQNKNQIDDCYEPIKIDAEKVRVTEWLSDSGVAVNEILKLLNDPTLDYDYDSSKNVCAFREEIIAIFGSFDTNNATKSNFDL